MPLFILFLLGLVTASEAYDIAYRREFRKQVKKAVKDPLGLDLED